MDPADQKKLLQDRSLRIIFSITLMAVMGVASISPVLPDVQKVFGIGKQEVGLLIVAFTLPGIFLSPFLGILADRYGRKGILVPSLFLFAIAGTACGFVDDFDWLIGLRFLQGIGGAAIGSINITLIGDLYAGKTMAKAMGYNASVLSIGTAAYPAIGGGLAMLGWYYPFFFPIVAIPVGLLVLFKLNNPDPEINHRFWNYIRQTLTYLNKKDVIGLFLISILTFIILYGAFLTYIPLLLNDSFKAEAWQIGIILSFSSIVTAVTSSQLELFLNRMGRRKLLMLAYVSYGVSMLSILIMPGIWYLLISVFFFGLAQGINIPSVQSMLAGKAPIQIRAVFMSINGSVLRLGQTLGPLVMGWVYVSFNLAATFIAAFFIALMMISIVFFLIKN
ncbi:MAG: MFS transporter [Bacteroidota bacterium]|nr:MFS transporter [Bacteroidota bacterium]